MDAPQGRKVICFDTSPLIWGVRGEATSSQGHMIDRTAKYIKFLRDNRYTIMVPAPVLAEYFVGANDTELQQRELLLLGFEYPVLDVKCAMLAVELQRGGIAKSVADEFNTSVAAIRIDTFILAIAISNHADKVITHDTRAWIKLARGRIAIEEVPDIQDQQHLF